MRGRRAKFRPKRGCGEGGGQKRGHFEGAGPGFVGRGHHFVQKGDVARRRAWFRPKRDVSWAEGMVSAEKGRFEGGGHRFVQKGGVARAEGMVSCEKATFRGGGVRFVRKKARSVAKGTFRGRFRPRREHFIRNGTFRGRRGWIGGKLGQVVAGEGRVIQKGDFRGRTGSGGK